MARARLQLLALESRDCPSVAVSTLDQGSTVRISGDSAADQVTITQNDTTDSLTVVWAGGSRSFRSSAVNLILVDLKGGNDTFDYLVQGDRSTYRKDLRIDLGQGNDTANFDFAGDGDPVHLRADLRAIVQTGDGNDTVQAAFGTIENRAKVTFRALLGTGDDSATIEMDGALTGQARASIDLDGGTGNDRLSVLANEIEIASQSDLNIWQGGGDGNDHLHVEYSGLLQGTLNTRIDAGKGNDFVNVQYIIHYLSRGTGSARAEGGLGDDTLRLGMFRALPPGDVGPPWWRMFGAAVGGEGHDIARTSSKITTTGCEELDGLVWIGG